MLSFYKITGTSHAADFRAILAQLRGHGATGDDDNAEPYDDAEVLQPLGLTARPVLTDDLELVAIVDGDEPVGLMMVDKSIATKTGDDPAIEEGETRLHGASADNVASMLRMKANGDVELRAKAGQKFEILVNDCTIQISAAGAINITGKSGQAITVNAQGSGAINLNTASGDVVLNGGSQKVARVNDSTAGHLHNLSGSAGPYPLAGTAVTTTDTISSSGGAAKVKA